MRRVGLCALALFLISSASQAWAEMNSAKRNQASGLAQIIAFSKTCGYEVDQDALERYFVDAGLSDAEALSYIHNAVVLVSEPGASECTITRATAKSLGLLK
ncbi:hypothetical protein ACD589_14985 [Rhizobium sp. 814_E9_N1_1]|uniref:hypothetical protein n=1 Tax=Rhizobium sp. 814_E9_N1_1 TaxID=3276276 RepID=UPI003F231905